MRRPTKRWSQQAHAAARARDRYDIHFDRAKNDEVVDLIQAGYAQLVERQSARVSVYRMQVDGRDCKVVYDRRRKQIVSFLPLEDRHDRPPSSTPG